MASQKQQQQQQQPADDWEQAADTEQQNLPQQMSRITISSQSFRPQANTFVPSPAAGAQPFYPQQQYYPPPQQQQQMYNAQQMYPQYGQPQYGYQQQAGGYGGGYGAQYGTTQPQQQYQPQVLQRGQPAPSQVRKENETSKPSGLPSLPPPRAPIAGNPSAAPMPGKSTAPTGPAKVLKIGGSAASPKHVERKEPPQKETESVSKPAPAEEPKPALTEPKETAKEKKSASKPTSGQTSTAPSVNGDESESRDADAVIKEQEEELDESLVQDMYGKEHVNVVFIGHVDAGKSTLGGNILFLTGMVDERTMEKYEKEAREAGRESWYLSWALDTSKEERSKGKTVEVGRARFETEKRRYTILDAPGHKSFVPNMISGAAQADVGVLVISARKGEFETGFDKGGQTREHAVLAKMQGINKLVIVINKMDDPTVEWSKERFDECTKRLGTFLKGNGFNPKTDLFFIPISAYKGHNLKDRVDKKICPWWDGPSLLEYLDSMQSLERKVKAPFMMPIGGKFKDMGTIIEGKIESGSIRKGSPAIIMPNKTIISIEGVYTEADEEMPVATSGDQVRLRIKGVEEEDISIGFVLCSPKHPVHVVNSFEAQVAIIELKNLMTAGYACVMHVHTAVVEVQFEVILLVSDHWLSNEELLHKLNKLNQRSKKAPAYATKGQKVVARLRTSTPLCLETFDAYPMLGRFTLRDQATTVAIGKITRLLED